MVVSSWCRFKMPATESIDPHIGKVGSIESIIDAQEGLEDPLSIIPKVADPEVGNTVTADLLGIGIISEIGAYETCLPGGKKAGCRLKIHENGQQGRVFHSGKSKNQDPHQLRVQHSREKDGWIRTRQPAKLFVTFETTPYNNFG